MCDVNPANDDDDDDDEPYGTLFICMCVRKRERETVVAVATAQRFWWFRDWGCETVRIKRIKQKRNENVKNCPEQRNANKIRERKKGREIYRERKRRLQKGVNEGGKKIKNVETSAYKLLYYYQ